MLSLLNPEKTMKLLSERRWTAKNDFFCFSFFLLLEWGSIPPFGEKVAYSFFLDKALTLLFIWICWSYAGYRQESFLRDFFALYRCFFMRILVIAVSALSLAGLLSSLGFLAYGVSLDQILDGYGFDAMGNWLSFFKPFAELNRSIYVFGHQGLSIFVLPSFFSLGDFIRWGFILFFWRSILVSLRRLSALKPLLALPEGDPNAFDLDE